MTPKRIFPFSFPILLAVLAAGCPGGEVNTEADAEVAYIGLDAAVDRIVALGFDGFNAADSANIPSQQTDGDDTGTITVDGQVDQGASANKGMRLDVALVDYSDGEVDDPTTEEEEAYQIVYDTAEAAPLDVDLQLKDIPDGTLDGTLVGTVTMSGDLEGEVTLDLSMAGEIEEDPDSADDVRRVDGSMRITGTAQSPYGTFDVDITR